jgi:hypothetical protein
VRFTFVAAKFTSECPFKKYNIEDYIPDEEVISYEISSVASIVESVKNSSFDEPKKSGVMKMKRRKIRVGSDIGQQKER